MGWAGTCLVEGLGTLMYTHSGHRETSLAGERDPPFPSLPREQPHRSLGAFCLSYVLEDVSTFDF